MQKCDCDYLLVSISREYYLRNANIATPACFTCVSSSLPSSCVQSACSLFSVPVCLHPQCVNPSSLLSQGSVPGFLVFARALLTQPFAQPFLDCLPELTYCLCTDSLWVLKDILILTVWTGVMLLTPSPCVQSLCMSHISYLSVQTFRIRTLSAICWNEATPASKIKFKSNLVINYEVKCIKNSKQKYWTVCVSVNHGYVATFIQVQFHVETILCLCSGQAQALNPLGQVSEKIMFWLKISALVPTHTQLKMS